VRTDNYVGHLPMHEVTRLCHNHEVRFDDFSGGSKELAVRSTEDCGVDFQPTTGQSNTRSPCVSGGASTTSYQLSFIGNGFSRFDRYRSEVSSGAIRQFGTRICSENNTAPRRGGEKTPRIGRSASAVAQACNTREAASRHRCWNSGLGSREVPSHRPASRIRPSASVIHARVPGGLSRRPRFMLSAPLGCHVYSPIIFEDCFPAV